METQDMGAKRILMVAVLQIGVNPRNDYFSVN